MKENLGPNRQYTRFVVWSRVMHPDWPRSHLAFRISGSQMAGLVLPRWMKDAVHLAATRGPFFWRYLSAGSTNCKRRMILFRVLYDWHTLFRIMCRQSVFFCCSSSAASWEGATLFSLIVKHQPQASSSQLKISGERLRLKERLVSVKTHVAGFFLSRSSVQNK